MKPTAPSGTPAQAAAASTPLTPAQLAKLDAARYVLVVGAMHDESRFRSTELPSVLDTSLSRELASLRRVLVLHADAKPAIAEAMRRGLPVLRLEGNVTELSRDEIDKQLAMHCEISLLVMDDAGRNLRTVLKGAATGMEPAARGRAERSAQVVRVARTAVDGAVRSALRNASSAIENAAASAAPVGVRDTARASLR